MYQINGNKPASGDKFFNTKSVGGYSSCIQGSPTISGLNVLCNCVGAACAFFNRTYSEITGYQGMKYPYLNCNAENFISRAKAYYPDIKIVQEPVEGGIMVWEGAGSLAGHVAFVIKCNSANSVYTAESGYGSFAYANYTRTNSNGRWGLGTSYKYLGCLVNPAVGEQRSYKSQPAQDISKKSVDELAREVIAGVYGNGDARKNALGSRYSEVQARVNEILNGGSTPAPAKKSNEEIAKEVINGAWGNGDERKRRLAEAGYDYATVQGIVNQMLGGNSQPAQPAPSVDILDLVRRTIRGDFGNGDARRNALGSNYAEVQHQVNENYAHGTTNWDNIRLY